MGVRKLQKTREVGSCLPCRPLVPLPHRLILQTSGPRCSSAGFDWVSGKFNLFLQTWARSLTADRSNPSFCARDFQNRNSLGQNPCTVGYILDASCRLGKSTMVRDPCVVDDNRHPAEYTYPPLTDNNEYYLPPTADHPGDLMCHCNPVMYRSEVLPHFSGAAIYFLLLNSVFTWPVHRVRGAEPTRKFLGSRECATC